MEYIRTDNTAKKYYNSDGDTESIIAGVNTSCNTRVHLNCI